MIRMIKRITASAVWDINGTEVTMKFSSKAGEIVTREQIISYLDCLKNKSYLADNTELCRAFEFFGGIAFVAVLRFISERSAFNGHVHRRRIIAAGRSRNNINNIPDNT